MGRQPASAPDAADARRRAQDRRDTRRRAQVVRSVLEEIVHGPLQAVTIDEVEASLQISRDAATRILDRLVSAGVLSQPRDGVWARVVA